MDATLAVCAAALSAVSLPSLKQRLELSRAKHPSLRGHARIAAWLARLVPLYEYDETTFFRSDDAPADVAARRRAGFEALAQRLREHRPRRRGDDSRGLSTDDRC